MYVGFSDDGGCESCIHLFAFYLLLSLFHGVIPIFIIYRLVSCFMASLSLSLSLFHGVWSLPSFVHLWLFPKHACHSLLVSFAPLRFVPLPALSPRGWSCSVWTEALVIYLGSCPKTRPSDVLLFRRFRSSHIFVDSANPRWMNGYGTLSWFYLAGNEALVMFRCCSHLALVTIEGICYQIIVVTFVTLILR